MIASSRNYPFNSRVTTIHAPVYSCMVSTTKEGFFETNSTMILEMPPGQLEPRRPVAKIIYASSLRPTDRLHIHDLIAQALDKAGESAPLTDAISMIAESLKDRGIAAEVLRIGDETDTTKLGQHDETPQLEQVHESREAVDAAPSIPAMLSGCDFVQARNDLAKFFQTMTAVARERGEEVYCPQDIMKALEAFMSDPCLDTATSLLEIAPQFLDIFELCR